MKSKFEKLEMLRGFAATYVLFSHLVLNRLKMRGSEAGLIFGFGQEVVMIFFLISGFVIYYSTAKHADTSFLPYLVRRTRRIYPIFLIALSLSFITAWISGSLAYAPPTWHQLFGNILMFQDFSLTKPGVSINPFCGNLPLWSLSYEWWFYMLFFPIYKYCSPENRLYVAGGISALGFITYTIFPNQPSLFLMYFILWWSGAELGRSYLEGRSISFSSEWRTLLVLAGAVVLVSLPVVVAIARRHAPSPGFHPVLELRHFGACLIILIAALLWKRVGWIGFDRVFKPFVVLAPISYALYVFHYPMVIQASYLDGLGPAWLQIGAYLAVVVVFAYLAELPLQRWINRKTDFLIPRPTGFPRDPEPSRAAKSRSRTSR